MPEHSDISLFLEPVVALAIEAGRRIMTIYESEFQVDAKPDHSPLTTADLAAHDCIVEGLQALRPAFPILSEESATAPFSERVGWESYWLVDPLDGTREFVRRNGEFTVNIALIHQHFPVLGVVYAPARDMCYYAVADGQGAFRRAGSSAPENIRVRASAMAPVRVAGSRSHGSPEMTDYLDRLGSHSLLSIGSSLKFCLVAEGNADLYPRLAPTSEWDTAAAQCVVEAAGGFVTDLSGQRLSYNTKESILNPMFLAYGDNAIDWRGFAGKTHD